MDIQKYSSVLKEGNALFTRVEQSILWNKNTIHRVDKKSIYLPFLNSYLSDAISVGKTLHLKYSDDYYEYSFESKIINIAICPSSSIELDVYSANQTLNTRVFRRHDIFLASTIKTDSDKVEFFTIITNISLGGLSFISNHSFEPGMHASISIKLPDQEMLLSQGIILRDRKDREGIIRYGFKFKKIDEINKSKLTRLLLEFEKNEDTTG